MNKIIGIKSFLLFSAVLLLYNNSTAENIEPFNRYFKILPKPQKIEMLNGNGIIFSAIKNICLKNTDRLPVLTGILDGIPITNSPKEGTVNLTINPNLNLPSPEGYILEVKNKQVYIQAKDQQGLFYGIQTLTQLLEDAHDQSVAIPSCKITDYPAIAFRAVHIDLKSHLDAGNYYYALIDRLAKVKINGIIIEFEDKLRYHKAKPVGAPNAISIEEFIALSKYAKDRYIEISPLVQGLGHASFILKHEEYKDLRDDSLSDYVFDPLNPKTYDLQFSLYEDAIAATPYGKYLHVGGDEVGKLGKSELSKKSGMKPLELQMYWLKKVSDFAVAHHRIPVFWDDMVFKLANLYQTTYDPELSEEKVKELWKKNEHLLNENISLFPKNCVYARWNYEAPQTTGNKMALDWYNANGLDVMASTAAQQGYLLLQRNHSNFKSIKGFCQLTAAKKLNSILCTAWDDSSPHLETALRGFYDFAWFSWNAAETSEQDVHSTFRHRFYAPELSADSSEFQNLLEEAVMFWETAFLSEGDREDYRPEFKLIEQPDINNPGEWSTKYKDKIIAAEKANELYSQIKSRIKKSLQVTRRNRYAVEVMNQINEVQAYSAKLILLLHQLDTSRTTGSKNNFLSAIRKSVEHFSELREHFDLVYSQTRMLKNPEGYLYGSNARSHWADIGNNKDWQFLIERQMNDKVTEWLVGQNINGHQ